MFCSWARHFTLTVPLSTEVYKWVPANLMPAVTLCWTSIPSRGEKKYSQSLYATETGISSGLIGHLETWRPLHHKRNWRNDHWLAVRASEEGTSDAFGECIFSVSACLPSFRITSCKQHDKCLWKRHQCPLLLQFYVSVILKSFDKIFFHGILPKETDAMFSQGTFPTATVISF